MAGMRPTESLHGSKVGKIQCFRPNINRPPGLPRRRAGISRGLQRLNAARVMGKQQIPPMTRKFKGNCAPNAARCTGDNGKARHPVIVRTTAPTVPGVPSATP